MAYTRDEVLTRVINDPEVKERLPLRFFRERYFPEGVPLETTYSRIQRFLNKNRIAGFRLERTPAEIVGEERPNSVKFETPQIKLKTPITANSLAEQDGSNNILRFTDSETKIDSAKARQARILLDLRKMVSAREEKMCAETLSGGWTYADADAGVSISMDFEFPSGNRVVLTDGDVWGSGTEGIISDLSDAYQTIEDGGGAVKEVVFGKSAYRNFRSDEDVLSILDNRGVNAGVIDETNRTDSRMKGEWEGAPIFKVTEQATERDGSTVELVNPNGVWVIGDNMETDMDYGLIAWFDETTKDLVRASTEIYAVEYIEGYDVQTKYIMVQSRPCPIIANPESVVYIQTA